MYEQSIVILMFFFHAKAVLQHKGLDIQGQHVYINICRVSEASNYFSSKVIYKGGWGHPL